MSKTPRTDEQILHHDNGNGHPSAFVFASFTRQLETELADKEKQLAEARAEIERLKCCGNCEYCNHKIEACEHPDNEPEDIMKGRCEHWRHDAEAAKGEV